MFLISLLFLQSGIYAQDVRTDGIADIEFGTTEEPISAFYPDEVITTDVSDVFESVVNMILPTESITSTHCHDGDDMNAHHDAESYIFDTQATDAAVAEEDVESFESAIAEVVDDFVDSEATYVADGEDESYIFDTQATDAFVAEEDAESFKSEIVEVKDDFVDDEATYVMAEDDTATDESAIVKRDQGLFKRAYKRTKLRPTATRKIKTFRSLDEDDSPTTFVTGILQTEDGFRVRTKAAKMVRTKVARGKPFWVKSRPTITSVN